MLPWRWRRTSWSRLRGSFTRSTSNVMTMSGMGGVMTTVDHRGVRRSWSVLIQVSPAVTSRSRIEDQLRLAISTDEKGRSNVADSSFKNAHLPCFVISGIVEAEFCISVRNVLNKAVTTAATAGKMSYCLFRTNPYNVRISLKVRCWWDQRFFSYTKKLNNQIWPLLWLAVNMFGSCTIPIFSVLMPHLLKLMFEKIAKRQSWEEKSCVC